MLFTISRAISSESYKYLSKQFPAQIAGELISLIGLKSTFVLNESKIVWYWQSITIIYCRWYDIFCKRSEEYPKWKYYHNQWMILKKYPNVCMRIL